MATVDQYTISSAMFRLAINIAAIGLAFVGLLSLSTFFLARRITEPLEKLSGKLNGLESRHWHYERSIYTGNELESVDEAGFELTQRLRTAHDHLEDIVKERTEALRRKLTENEAILESIDYGIFVTDEHANIVYANKAGEALVGTSISDETTASRILKLVDKDGNLLTEHDHPIYAVLRSGQSSNPSTDPEYSIRLSEEKEIPVQVRVTPMMRGKRCIGVVAVLRNTTEERRIDKIKSEFISLVSHQLRTPLSSMRWYLEMLTTKDAGPLTTDQEEYVREASTSNARMVHLVNGLLNVSRLEMGKMQTKTEAVDIEKVVKETTDTFVLELKQKNIILAMKTTSLDGLPIRSDRGLLQLIVENFLSNAIKYSKENTTITLRLIGDVAKKTITISVTDTGIGIPMEQREFIGTRLFRGANARLENTDGNGLGLYISMIAAEAIGATLTFESKQNEGSTFLLKIPVIVPAPSS
jgi:PAS domain S-box-containing protein